MFFRLSVKYDTRTVGIRQGTPYEEYIAVKREWVYPWRDASRQKGGGQPAYYDIVVQELGMISSHITAIPFQKKLLE